MSRQPRAAVAAETIAVIALLADAGLRDRVAAEFDLTLLSATVAACQIAVVTLFVEVQNAVPALFGHATRRAAVAIRQIAVVALFRTVDGKIAAHAIGMTAATEKRTQH